MNVAFNQMIIKIAADDIPETFQEFVHETLPQNLSPVHLPQKYALRYLDIKRLPITVMNEKNYKTMRQVMKEKQDDLDFFIIPEQPAQIIKVEEGADELPIRNHGPAHPIVDEISFANKNEDPQSNLGGGANNQGADKSPILNDHAAEQGVSAQVNENPQSMAEPVQENPMNLENSQGISSIPIFTQENLEWIVNEPDALRKGLSDRIEESQKGTKKNSKKTKKANKGSQGNRRSKLRNEVRYLEKTKNTQREVWEDFENGLVSFFCSN